MLAQFGGLKKKLSRENIQSCDVFSKIFFLVLLNGSISRRPSNTTQKLSIYELVEKNMFHTSKRENVLNSISTNSLILLLVPLIKEKLRELLWCYRTEVKWSEVKSLSRVRLFVTPWTVAHQAPPSMGFSRQEYWRGLPFPSPGDLPDPGIKPGSPAL